MITFSEHIVASSGVILTEVTPGVFFSLLGSEGCFLIVDPRSLPETDSIVSAMKIYTTLKKISTKTVYYEKSWSILKSVNQKI